MEGQEHETSTLRVVSFNLLRLTMDADAAARVVRAADPDVLGVQEPPRGPWGRVRLRRFARAAGLRVVLAGRGARTTALLAAPRVLPAHDVAVLRLRWWGSRLVRRWWARRGVVMARVAGLHVVVVHLALDAPERLRHTDEILAALATREGPTVVLGDLNEPPTGPVWARLAPALTDAAPDGAPTFPATSPRHRIDAVLVSPGVMVREVSVLDGPDVLVASDHLPLVADLA
ncbi:MAG: endonuclease/exonuclease/phosphatase [Actinomycetales bacterium]|nr:endonuclease/exonuclease/phosphatase [Actinomycetales bacterium]